MYTYKAPRTPRGLTIAHFHKSATSPSSRSSLENSILLRNSPEDIKKQTHLNISTSNVY